MTTRVALVASARTGSSWLASLLDSHPAIRFHGELFNLERMPADALHDPLAYLETSLGDDGGAACVGFKLLEHQMRLSYLNDFLAELDAGRESRVDWRRHFPRRPVTADMAPALPRLWHALRDDRRYRLVHLTRRNLLRQRLSHERLMTASRARWSATAAPELVTVAPQHLVAAFERHARAVAELQEFFADRPPLEVAYEDLSADTDGEVGRILDFLAVPRARLRSAMRRNPPRPLRALLANYDEVVQALTGTAWAEMLDEPIA